MKTRRCRKCNRPTPLDQFDTTKKGNRRYVCPTCVQVEKDAARAKRRRRQWPKFDPSVYEDLLVEQYGRCAICGEFSERTLHLDHDHETGALRGLLCQLCNTGLGMFRDNPELLRKAVEYVQKHKYRQQRAAQELARSKHR